MQIIDNPSTIHCENTPPQVDDYDVEPLSNMYDILQRWDKSLNTLSVVSGKYGTDLRQDKYCYAAHRKETKITHYISYISLLAARLRLRCVTTTTTKTQKKLPSTKIVSHTHVMRATFSTVLCVWSDVRLSSWGHTSEITIQGVRHSSEHYPRRRSGVEK